MAPPRLAWPLLFEWPNASILKGVPKFDAPYEEFLELRGATFELVKSTFNAQSFVLRLTQSISSDFSAIHS